MGASRGTDRPLNAPSASRQISFHQLLVAARKTWLKDALARSLRRVDPDVLRQQLAELAPPDARQTLAAAGIRDEYVFPAPVVLEAEPALVGYYRLLLGVPRKGFYTSETGMAAFKSMEESGRLTDRQRGRLAEFCAAMGKELANLVRQISPQVTRRDIDELPLLTLGSMLQGANNVRIGEEAKRNVFVLVREIVKEHIAEETADRLTLRNAAGRLVVVSFGADPDICVNEEFGGRMRARVAIEIKGGTDASNAHNRAGEAEKAHQKARKRDFRDFWTIIAKKNLDMRTLSQESPTTTSWFDVAQILGRTGPDWEDFRSRLAGELGIPLGPAVKA
jgi:hypothetical protein